MFTARARRLQRIFGRSMLGLFIKLLQGLALPPSVFHAMSPFAVPPWMTAAAADGLVNSTSRVKTNRPSFSFEHALRKQLLALRQRIGIVAGGWPLFENGR
jgi:hypothetical protein